MLRNVSYNNSIIKSEINDLLGKPFTIFERIKLGGVGSPKYFILQTDIKITNLLNLDNNTNQCNIELRPKGIIISFRSLLETYGLVIPYYKLKLFKGNLMCIQYILTNISLKSWQIRKMNMNSLKS
jgi:hypothetical protein